MGEKEKFILKKKKIKKEIKELERLYKLNPKKTYINKMFKLREKIKMIGGVKKKQKNKKKSAIKDRLMSRNSTLVARPIFHYLNTRTIAIGEKYPKKKISHRPSKSSFKQNLQEKKDWMKFRYGTPIKERGEYDQEQTVGFAHRPMIRIFPRNPMGPRSNVPIFERERVDYLGGFVPQRHRRNFRPIARPRMRSSGERTRQERARVQRRDQTAINTARNDRYEIERQMLNRRM